MSRTRCRCTLAPTARTHVIPGDVYNAFLDATAQCLEKVQNLFGNLCCRHCPRKTVKSLLTSASRRAYHILGGLTLTGRTVTPWPIHNRPPPRGGKLDPRSEGVKRIPFLLPLYTIRACEQHVRCADQALAARAMRFSRRRWTEEGIPNASRYFATVRRAISMPSTFRRSTILSSERTSAAGSASIISRMR